MTFVVEYNMYTVCVHFYSEKEQLTMSGVSISVSISVYMQWMECIHIYVCIC